MYEHRTQPLLPRAKFAQRVARHGGIAFVAVILALLSGVMGYHYFAHLGWIDALVNASMILGGMGPVNVMTSDRAKVFASVYALFSGLFFIGLLAVLLVPFAHRLLHRLHLEDDASERDI